MEKHLTAILVISMLFISSCCFSQQLSYKPKNPAFGGDTFNYNWLLSSANAQNGLLAPVNPNDELSELERLAQTLRTQALSQISRTVLQQQVGGLGDLTEPGSYVIGNLTVEVFESNEGLVINIFDTSNGEQTQVVIPIGG